MGWCAGMVVRMGDDAQEVVCLGLVHRGDGMPRGMVHWEMVHMGGGALGGCAEGMVSMGVVCMGWCTWGGARGDGARYFLASCYVCIIL